MDLEVMCLDCEEQWDPYHETPHCLCNDPAEDAWILFIRDSSGKWVKTLADAVDDRYNKFTNPYYQESN